MTHNANALPVQYRRLRRPSITVLAEAYSDEELATLVRLLEKLTLPLGSSGALNQPTAAVAAATRMSSPGSGSGPGARG